MIEYAVILYNDDGNMELQEMRYAADNPGSK